VIPPLEPLLDQWRKTYGDKYLVDAQQLIQKGFQHPNFLPKLSIIKPNGFLIAKQDPYGTLFGEPHLNRIHINSIAYASHFDGQQILAEFLRKAPNQPITFGQDQGHFFPGVPEECPELQQLLADHGFEPQGDWANDVEADLAIFNPQPEWLAPLSQNHAEVRPCTSHDIPALEQFLIREFPGRWHYDVAIEKAQKFNEPGGILALWVNQQIHGFAYMQSNSSTQHPTGGFTWHLDLGPNPGSLGPIGISKAVRGTGLGGALLVAGLNHLKQAGVRQCIIDWTSLVDFYGKYGFCVNRRYKAMTKSEN
jgi:ribosomal protein S18 acetylase RimI-like enzyme